MPGAIISHTLCILRHPLCDYTPHYVQDTIALLVSIVFLTSAKLKIFGIMLEPEILGNHNINTGTNLLLKTIVS